MESSHVCAWHRVSTLFPCIPLKLLPMTCIPSRLSGPTSSIKRLAINTTRVLAGELPLRIKEAEEGIQEASRLESTQEQ